MRVCAVCLRCYEDAVGNCLIENHNPLSDGRPGSCEIIPSYKIESLVEINDLYEVYSAVNHTNNEICVIKIIPANLISDPALNQQILHETQALSAYHHANLVGIYESGILSNGDLYIVSESVKGQTLRESLSNIGVPAEITAVTIARQSLEGLEALHTLGVAHRNINPDNILLTTDAENRLLVKIQNIDFGGINQQSTAFNLSNSEKNLNKLKYFSPEQCILGENVDHLTDIYSIGIVLHEMLAGKPPFESSEASEIIEKHLKAPIPSIHIANFDIRALLTHILSLAMQKHPASRHKTANTFSRQLRHLEQIVTHTLAPAPAVLKKVSNNAPHVEIVSTQKLNEFFEKQQIEPKQENQKVLSEQDVNDVIDSIKPVALNASVSLLLGNTLTESNKTKPVLVEWEQPEDIPLETDIPQVREYPQQNAGAYQLYNEEDFVTNSPDKEFEEEEFQDDDYKTTVIPVVASLEQTAPQGFVISNQAKFIGGGVAAILALIVLGSFINNRIFSSSQPRQENTAVSVSEKKTVQPKETENLEIAKETNEQSAEQELVSNQTEMTNLEETAKRISSDVSKDENHYNTEKVASVVSKSNEENLTKEKTSKDLKPSQQNLKLDKKGNPKPVKEDLKNHKTDNFSRPRIVAEHPNVKITDNLKNSAKNDSKKRSN